MNTMKFRRQLIERHVAFANEEIKHLNNKIAQVNETLNSSTTKKKYMKMLYHLERVVHIDVFAHWQIIK